MASDIMERTYIYQFVTRKPNSNTMITQPNKKILMLYEFFRQKIIAMLTKMPNTVPYDEYVDVIPIERDKPFNTLL